MRKITKLKWLSVCIFMAQHSYALQQLSDTSLSTVTGQDGISITHEVSKVVVEQANWVDYSNTGKMKLGLHNVRVEGTHQQNIKSTLDIDVGKTERGVGIKIQGSISPFQATVEKLMLICDTSCTNTVAQQNLGSLSLATISPLIFNLETTAGLFNRDEKAHLDFRLQNASIGYGLNGHNLTLKDLNFNISADGYMYIDPTEGIVLATKSKNGATDHVIELGRVSDLTDVHSSRSDATNPGVNLDLRYGSDPANQKNLIRMGASGALTNGKIFLNADQTGLANFNTVNATDLKETTRKAQGYDTKGGLHLGLAAEFTRQGNPLLTANHQATTLELGHTGKGSYAIEFSNLSPLAIRNANSITAYNTQNAYIDLGDIYINAAQTPTLSFIINENMRKVLGETAAELFYNIVPSGTTQNIALLAMRGMDFQAIARKARFISDNSMAALTNQSAEWGIGIPIFNLNTNLALFSKNYSYHGSSKAGLGYNLALSTEGYGIDQKTNTPSTTSLIIVDGARGSHGEEVNYYAGFRNIDAYLKSDGVIGFEDEGIYIKADHLLLAAKAEIAIGQLPGSLYNCPAGVTSCDKKVVPIDNFARKNDVLTSLAFKLDGNGELFIIPGVNPTEGNLDSNFLTLKANFDFSELNTSQKQDPSVLGSYVSLINEDIRPDGTSKTSSININKMQGSVGLESRVYVKQDTVKVDSQIQFNRASTLMSPGQVNTLNTGKIFKAEMAMSPSGSMQKIADLAITGGTMRSTLGITPR
jgi:hypothetical protein